MFRRARITVLARLSFEGRDMWRTIERGLKIRTLQWLGRHQVMPVLTPEEIDWTGVNRILVIRQHDQFGDFLLTTPALRALRLRFPQARITLVVRDYLEPVARNNPDIDHLLVFHESAWRWTPHAILQFKEELATPFDLAVVFNTVSHSLSSDLIAAFSGARVRLGPETPTFDHCTVNPFYTLLAPVDPAQKHQVDRNLDVVRYIGAETDSHQYRFRLTDAEEVSGRLTLASLLPSSARRVIGLHFGTGDIRKRYPIAQLAHVCDQLGHDSATALLAIPAPGEDALLDALTKLTTVPLIQMPTLPLRIVASVLDQLNLLICNDTGVLHLAAAVNTPTVSFHAISDPAVWKPIGPRFIGLYARNGSIGTIPVDEVITAVQDALAMSESRSVGELEIREI